MKTEGLIEVDKSDKVLEGIISFGPEYTTTLVNKPGEIVWKREQTCHCMESLAYSEGFLKPCQP